jgi:hypothetical protein
MTQTPTDALRLVPVEATMVMKNAAWGALAAQGYAIEDIEVDPIWQAMLAAAPASPLPGGGPYERWSILNHLGESWTPENFDTERQATAFLDRWKRDNPKMDLSKHKVIPVLVTMTAAPTGEPK